MPNILAVGDFDGTLHVLEIPYSLYKKIGDEEKTMQDYWNREVARVNYVKKRFEIRAEDLKKDREEREK